MLEAERGIRREGTQYGTVEIVRYEITQRKYRWWKEIAQIAT